LQFDRILTSRGNTAGRPSPHALSGVLTMTIEPSVITLHRSEAFAEDLVGLVAVRPEPAPPRRLHRLANWLPLGVALLGVAFAVVPPLA
jgi:hypothetical protein